MTRTGRYRHWIASRPGWLAIALALLCSSVLAARAEAYVYWTSGYGFVGGYLRSIGRANLDGTAANWDFINATAFQLAVDGTHVYWTDSYGPGFACPYAIGRANLDGSAVNRLFVPIGGCSAGGLAVDGAYVYWTWSADDRSGPVAIARANLDGSGADPRFINAAATALAVDGTHVYWTDSNGRSIGRANLDGSVANPRFINVAARALAVDGTHVYWTNYATNTIGCANLDGSGVNQGFINGASAPMGVAVDSSHVYWANVNSNVRAGSLGRANLDGSGVIQRFITTATPPSGVAVDGFGPPPGSAPPGGAPQITSVTQSATSWRLGSAVPTATPTAVTCPSVGIAGNGVRTGIRQALEKHPGHRARAKPPVGTTFGFTLDRPARAQFAFTHTVTGRRIGGKCLAQTKNNQRKPRCQRTVPAATLSFQGHAGRNSLHFEGRINRKRKLLPDPYALTITATADGLRSKPAILRFTILS